MGIQANGQRIFPTISGEAARFLARERGVYGFGVDTHTPDLSEPTGAHRAFATDNVYIVENLANLAQVPSTGAYAHVTPMKLAGSGGAAARVFAIVSQ